MWDAELLQEYANSESEAAFRQLVEQYLPLVYSAAVRQVGNPALAEDVTQVVFIILARKARQLSSGTILAGWLFKTTRHTAARAMRSEQRRRRREQEAIEMQRAQPHDIWERVAPALDEALAQLGEIERNAVLLHYFQNKRLRDVGLALGMTEDTAQKRVSRALEKLRKFFAKRKLALPVIIIPGLLMTRGAQAAPSYLGISVAATALGKTALSTQLFVLLQEALRESPWPKVGVTLSKLAGVAIIAGLAFHLWPKPGRQGLSGYSFESRIVLRPPGNSLPITRSPTPPMPTHTPAVEAPNLNLAQVATNPIAPPPGPVTPMYRAPVTNVAVPVYEAAAVYPIQPPPQTSGESEAPVQASNLASLPAGAVGDQIGYQPEWNNVPAVTRLQPAFYNRSYGRNGLNQYRRELPVLLPNWYVNSSAWMPAQRPALPVAPRWNSSTPTKKQP